MGAGVAVGGSVMTGMVRTGSRDVMGSGVTVASQLSQLVDSGVEVSGASVGVAVAEGGTVLNKMASSPPVSRLSSVISSGGT